jgi:hypothetical protein
VAEVDDAIGRLHDTVDDVRDSAHEVRRALGQPDVELDLADEAGRRASWETLVGKYGFGPLIELFLKGLWVCERADLAPHFEDLLQALQANWDGDAEDLKELIDDNATEREDEDEAEDEPEPASGVVPLWCRPGRIAVRTEALRQALEAAGTAGLRRYDDVIPLGRGLSDAAIDRGQAAISKLKEAVNVVFLARYAPGTAEQQDTAGERATHDTCPLAPEEPEAAPAKPHASSASSEPEATPASPLEAALEKAGGKGMSTFELMQATGLDMVGLPAALAPLREAGSVIERDGRYYAADPSGGGAAGEVVKTTQVTRGEPR